MEKKSYTYDEAFKSALEYFNGDELAARVWVNKYAVKDSYGTIYEKSPEDMHWRIANEIARIESKPQPSDIQIGHSTLLQNAFDMFPRSDFRELSETSALMGM